MFAQKPRRDGAWYLLGGIWIVTLVALLVQNWLPHSSTTGAVLQNAFLWPLGLLSLLLFVTAMRVLFASTEDTLLTHYASLDLMQRLQRSGLLSFLSLPLLGGAQIALCYPLFLATSSSHPFLGVMHGLCLYAILALFLWQDNTRWWAFLGSLGLAAGLGVGGYLWKHTFPSWGAWTSQLFSVAVVAILLLAMYSLTLRWWRGSQGQHASRHAAHGLLGCVALSQGLLLVAQAQDIQRGINLLIAILLVCFLTWAGAQALRETQQLLRLPHALASLHYRPYIFGATLPLALLVGLGGWARQVAVTPSMLLSLVGAQLLAFTSFSTLHSIHRVGWGEPHPIWVILRPILVFLVAFFPFGFPLLTMLGAWSK